LEAKAREKVDAPRLRLIYFPARGRAEAARVMLREAGIAFDDVRMEYKQFVDSGTKAGAVFGQMPLLEVGGSADGKQKPTQIAQSGAIFRYVAKLTGLYGHNAEEAARVDMICETLNGELGNAYTNAYYEKDAKLKDEKLAKFWAETFPEWSGKLDKIIGASKTGFFVGNALTMADVATMVEGQRYLKVKPDCLNAAPHLLELITRVAARPNIAKWCKERPAE